MTESLFQWEGLGEKTDDDILAKLYRLVLSIESRISHISEHLTGSDEQSLNVTPGDANEHGTGSVSGAIKTLPDPRLLRRVIKQRTYRATYFPDGLFADPAWDMLLDLAAAQAEFRQVSITSLCLASGVPGTTALRYVELLISTGLCARRPDTTDRRRTWITLTDRGVKAVAAYFHRIMPQDRSVTETA